jgi:branched-chain amino acid transport system permease protein
VTQRTELLGMPVTTSLQAGRTSRVLALSAVSASLLAFPWIVNSQDYLLYNAAIGLLYVLLATGYNILLGLCGQLALAHVAFFGIGAYVSALLTRDLGIVWPVALSAAMLVPTLAAWVMARAALRFTGPYLAMVTFAFHSAVLTVLTNWVGLTNGWGGVSRIPPAAVAGFQFDTTLRTYFLLLAFTGAGLYFAHRIKHSRLGRAMMAVRENRLAAKGIGIDTAATITVAFCLSGAYAGLAGSLHAHVIHYIDPTTFGLPRLIDLLIIIIVGGRGSIFGVAAAALAFIFALEYLRFLQDWKLMMFGVLLVLMMNASPNGLGELVERFRPRAR